MLNMLKTDLRRIFKDKLFLVICIICGVFALLTPLLLYAVGSIAGDAAQMLGMGMDAKTLFFQAFNPVNDFGLVASVLFCIILCKDYSQGTVRNKIISGKSRSAVFLSALISCTIVLCGIMLVYAFLTLGVSLLLFEYQATPFTANDFGYAVVTLIFKLLTFVVVSALITFLSVSMKNAGLCIVMYIAITMLFSIIGASFSMVIPTVLDNEPLKLFLEFMVKSNVFLSTVTGNGTTYSAVDVAVVLISHALYFALFFVLGLVAIKKKDIK